LNSRARCSSCKRTRRTSPRARHGRPTFFVHPRGSSSPASSPPRSACLLTSRSCTRCSIAPRTVLTGETSMFLMLLAATSLGHRAEPSVPWYDPVLGLGWGTCARSAGACSTRRSELCGPRTRARGGGRVRHTRRCDDGRVHGKSTMSRTAAHKELTCLWHDCIHCFMLTLHCSVGSL